jgi:hypothetical protein
VKILGKYEHMMGKSSQHMGMSEGYIDGGFRRKIIYRNQLININIWRFPKSWGQPQIIQA